MRSLRSMALPVALVILLSAGTSGAVQSESAPPRVFKLTWTTLPLTARTQEVLEIRAVDPDSVVTTANVLWGDGVFTHADLICFDEGEVVRVLLSTEYSKPGPIRCGSG